MQPDDRHRWIASLHHDRAAPFGYVHRNVLEGRREREIRNGLDGWCLRDRINGRRCGGGVLRGCEFENGRSDGRPPVGLLSSDDGDARGGGNSNRASEPSTSSPTPRAGVLRKRRRLRGSRELRSESARSRGDSAGDDTAPIALAHVCRKWRRSHTCQLVRFGDQQPLEHV